MDDKLSATVSNEFSEVTLKASIERFNLDQESVPVPQYGHNKGIVIDKGHSKTDSADAEAITSSQTVSTVFTSPQCC